MKRGSERVSKFEGAVPSDIESYLTPEEKMIKIGGSRKWEIYLTDKRVIFRKAGMFGKEIIDVSYRYISSIEYKKQIPWVGIIGGAFLVVFAFFVDDMLGLLLSPLSVPGVRDVSHQIAVVSQIVTILFILLGIVSVAVGLLTTRGEYKIHIVGRPPLPISGEGLEDIIRIIRQYREKVEADITKLKSE